MTERCDKCRFYMNLGSRTLDDGHPDDWVGNCRRFPSVFIPTPDEDLTLANQEVELWAQPVMFATDWCGEFMSASPSRQSEGKQG